LEFAAEFNLWGYVNHTAHVKEAVEQVGVHNRFDEVVDFKVSELIEERRPFDHLNYHVFILPLFWHLQLHRNRSKD
jgi:hypothetical protein